MISSGRDCCPPSPPRLGGAPGGFPAAGRDTPDARVASTVADAAVVDSVLEENLVAQIVVNHPILHDSEESINLPEDQPPASLSHRPTYTSDGIDIGRISLSMVVLSKFGPIINVELKLPRQIVCTLP